MTDLIVLPQTDQWQKLKALVLDSVSSPITKRVYNHALDEFFAWYGREPRPGFTKATVRAWRVALEARGLGSVTVGSGKPVCCRASSAKKSYRPPTPFHLLNWVQTQTHSPTMETGRNCKASSQRML